MPASEQERNEMAQKLYGKNFDECDAMERVKVGSHLGGGRIQEMAGKTEHAAGKDVGEGGGNE